MRASTLPIVKKAFILFWLQSRLRKQATERELGPSPTLNSECSADPLQGQRKGTVMRRVLMMALATAAIGLGSTSAGAVTLQLCTSGASCVSGTTNVLLNSFDAPGALTVTGNVGGPGGNQVNFSSTNGLLETNTGAATIFRADAGQLSQLTFTLLTGTFSSAEFNLEQGDPKAFDILLSVSGGGSKIVSIANANGSNVFDVIGAPGETFTSASFLSTGEGTGFKTFKQLRLVMATGAVPEPGTWGLMLLGFAGVGMALRRSRRRSGALMQIA
jgi:hypothetical protein